MTVLVFNMDEVKTPAFAIEGLHGSDHPLTIANGGNHARARHVISRKRTHELSRSRRSVCSTRPIAPSP